jgi:hypothetical protein
MDNFVSARLKLKRAEKHIADLKSLTTDLPNRYVRTAEFNPQIGVTEVIYRLPDAADIVGNLALTIGDAVHNIYSALDHSYVGVVLRHASAAKSERTKFPFYPNEQALKGSLKGVKIHELSPRLFDLLVSNIKPYSGINGGNEILRYIRNLDMRDKHELLIPTLNIPLVKGLAIQNQQGEVAVGDTLLLRGNGNLDIIFHVAGDHKIKDEGKLAITVVLEHIHRLQAVEICSLLKNFLDVVLHIVKLFESL